MELSGQLYTSAVLTRYPLHTTLGWLQKRFGPFGEEENYMPLLGFVVRTLQSVAQ
jgi:hypothetical protein